MRTPCLISAITLCSSLCAPLAHAQSRVALRQIVSNYETIEAEYKDWTHFSFGAGNLEGGQAYENHVWESDGDTGFIKVESNHFDVHGDSLVNFYFKGSELIFTLERCESTRMEPKAPTEVTETRYYFADGQLIRTLRKQGKFPAGTETDTAELKNEEIPPGGHETPPETYVTQHSMAWAIIEQARVLDEGKAPQPSETPEKIASTSRAIGDGWRMIAGSASRDGMLALAWGLKGQAQSQGDKDEDGNLSTDPDNKDLINCVVDLRSGRIIGETNGHHFGDKTQYNHETNETAWSADDSYVAQIVSWKWYTDEASLYRIEDDRSLSRGTDLLEPASKAVFEHLEGSDQLKHFGKSDFAITLHDVRIVRQGSASVVQMEVTGQVPKSEDDAAYFDATVSFVIKNTDVASASPELSWSSTEGH